MYAHMTDACEFPKHNATSAEIREIFRSSKVIAVVGISDNPERPSFGVSKYLQDHGYQMIPVNPALTSVHGEKAYPDLKSIPVTVDIVDIFRKPEAVPAIVDETIHMGAKVVWMQEGIVHNEAAEKARQAGLKVVMNKCIMKELRGS